MTEKLRGCVSINLKAFLFSRLEENIMRYVSFSFQKKGYMIQFTQQTLDHSHNSGIALETSSAQRPCRRKKNCRNDRLIQQSF